MKSPIKYYGGKSYMTNIIIDHFPKEYEVYVEGFGGGASVLFQKEKTRFLNVLKGISLLTQMLIMFLLSVALMIWLAQTEIKVLLVIHIQRNMI